MVEPLKVRHTAIELKKLANFLKSLDGKTRVVMEHTGRYYQPVAQYIHKSGVSLCRVKTDKADSLKIIRYALDN